MKVVFVVLSFKLKIMKGAEVDNKKITLTVMILTLITMAAEVVIGYVSGSMALLADGWHMGTHALAFALTYAAYCFADYCEKKGKSVAREKVNSLAGYTSALFLGLVAVSVIAESVARLINPQNISFNEAIVVAFIGLFVNAVCLVIMGDKLHFHYHNNKKEDEKDYNFKSAYLHVMTDLLTSVLAITALFGAKFFGLTFLDSVVGVLGGAVILKWAFGLLRDTFKVLTKEGDDKC